MVITSPEHVLVGGPSAALGLWVFVYEEIKGGEDFLIRYTTWQEAKDSAVRAR